MWLGLLMLKLERYKCNWYPEIIKEMGGGQIAPWIFYFRTHCSKVSTWMDSAVSLSLYNKIY